MRKSANLSIPLGLITLYYIIMIAGFFSLVYVFPALEEYLPVGGIDALLERDPDSFEVVETVRHAEAEFSIDPFGAVRLAIASFGTALLMMPISWVYVITNRAKRIEQSFVQTIVILPIVVTGIAMIVQNSLALAFSLAGIVG